MYIFVLFTENINSIKGGDILNNMKILVTCIVILAIIATMGIISINNDVRTTQSTILNSLEKFDDLLMYNVNAESGTSSRDNTQLLARAINGEARGEPYIGQVAVGAVICNRTRHPSFPKSIPGVIYQPGAFTAVSDGQINTPIATNSLVFKAAKDSLNGWDPTGGAIYYYNPAKTTNKWIWSRQVVTTIGKLKFAK
jgi:N-acetylmuramoyl-L-alanine amidase